MQQCRRASLPRGQSDLTAGSVLSFFGGSGKESPITSCIHRGNNSRNLLSSIAELSGSNRCRDVRTVGSRMQSMAVQLVGRPAEPWSEEARYSSEVPQPCSPHRTTSDPTRLHDQRLHLHRTALPPVVVQEVSRGPSLQLAISPTTGAVQRQPALDPRCGLVAAFGCRSSQWFQSPLGFAVRLKWPLSGSMFRLTSLLPYLQCHAERPRSSPAELHLILDSGQDPAARTVHRTAKLRIQQAQSRCQLVFSLAGTC
jgi:hypothetical protein